MFLDDYIKIMDDLHNIVLKKNKQYDVVLLELKKGKQSIKGNICWAT